MIFICPKLAAKTLDLPCFTAMPQEIDAGGYSISRRISSDNSSKPQRKRAGFPTLIVRGCDERNAYTRRLYLSHPPATYDGREAMGMLIRSTNLEIGIWGPLSSRMLVCGRGGLGDLS
ncbi:hypothetical protein CC2G_004547 [Coprinopsis cinerea AmutBmut pab1-1]|nr:hypothetical protein CC2G_004547 [Coprinopsis cinerea AmutBmut pab1-1]